MVGKWSQKRPIRCRKARQFDYYLVFSLYICLLVINNYN